MFGSELKKGLSFIATGILTLRLDVVKTSR